MVETLEPTGNHVSSGTSYSYENDTERISMKNETIKAGPVQ